MKHVIPFLLCGLLVSTPSAARKKTQSAKPSVTVASAGGQQASAAKPETTKGLFTVTKQGEDYFFEIADSLLSREFLTTVRLTQAPANVGKFAGEQINQQTIYFEKAPGDKLLMRSNILMNTADSIDAINRAVTISNTNPIVAAFKIESHAKGMYKVKVTSLLNDDNAAFSVPQYYKQNFGLTGFLPQLSYVESVKTFPMNTEIRLVRTFMSQQPRSAAASATGKVTFGLNISFVLLPKKPMMRRFFDPRVGYFTDDFVYFSDNQQRVEPKRFITRWRLEPKDSADMEKMKRGELVEPKKPIVYYIDPATPKQWRKYLIQGVEDWQKAFEAAGFKNAILAKEWPDSDKTMSMEDARYSVIRYLAAPIENAYGPQVHDPRSGEILESHICWYHNVMTLVHDWYMIQAGTLDEAARKMKYDTELMGELIRFVSSHEVGHTLGLRHNFGSSSTVPVDSLRNKAFVEAHGHTPSIMDYARFNYVAQPEDGISRAGIFPRIGDYDVWAIKWGYTPMWNAYDDNSDHYELEKMTNEAYANARVDSKISGQPRIWFGDGETNTTRDSRCQTEDLGDDAVKASYYGIRNLKRMLPQLPEWTYQSNDIYSTNLKSMYQQVQSQFLRYMGHVIRNIGGVYKNYGTVDNGGNVYINVSKARQKECLKFVADNVITEPTWFREPAYVKSIFPDVNNATYGIAARTMMLLVNSSLLNGLNSEYEAPEYLQDLTNYIFKSSTPSQYTRDVQKLYVQNLIDFFKSASLSNDARPAVLSTLKQLRKKLSMPVADAKTQAHNASLVDAIDRALVIK